MIRGAAELEAKFRRMAPALAARLLTVINEQDARLEAHIKADKLSGQVLHRRTGGLSRSIHSEPAKNVGGSIIGRVGTNVIYAPVHEFGATIYARRAKFLRFKTPDGRWHSRKSVTIPARPFMKPSLEERKPEILQAIGRAVRETINGP